MFGKDSNLFTGQVVQEILKNNGYAMSNAAKDTSKDGISPPFELELSTDLKRGLINKLPDDRQTKYRSVILDELVMKARIRRIATKNVLEPVTGTRVRLTRVRNVVPQLCLEVFTKREGKPTDYETLSEVKYADKQWRFVKGPARKLTGQPVLFTKRANTDNDAASAVSNTDVDVVAPSKETDFAQKTEGTTNNGESAAQITKGNESPPQMVKRSDGDEQDDNVSPRSTEEWRPRHMHRITVNRMKPHITVNGMEMSL